MARIRSIHPGQWTDENFVSCSAFARLLAIGLRNEADDQGVFEWKPLMLKMRLFPADNIDVETLLEELVGNSQIVRFVDDESEKTYGAIRNFRRWQRPDKPKSVHPLPDELREYVGLSPIAPPKNDTPSPSGRRTNGADEPPVGDQSPTDRRSVGDQSAKVVSEGGCRRKEEGCRREEGSKLSKNKKIFINARACAREGPPTDGADAPDDDDQVFEKAKLMASAAWQAAGTDQSPTRADIREAEGWIRLGYITDAITQVIRDVVARRDHDPPRSLKYFTPELTRQATQNGHSSPKDDGPWVLHDGTVVPDEKFDEHLDGLNEITKPLGLSREERVALDVSHMTLAEARALVAKRLGASA